MTTVEGVCEATHDYTAQGEFELSFKAGDRLLILAKNLRSGWWDVRAEASGHEGFVPSNHLRLVAASGAQSSSPATPLPSGVECVCETRYDAEEKNELTILPGDRIRVVKRNDETGWSLGVSSRGKGWFPMDFVKEL